MKRGREHFLYAGGYEWREQRLRMGKAHQVKEYWSSRLHKGPLKPRNRRSSRRRGGLVGHRAYGIPTMKVVVVRGKVSLQRD